VAIGVGPFVYSNDLIEFCKIYFVLLGRTTNFSRVKHSPQQLVAAKNLLQETTKKIYG